MKLSLRTAVADDADRLLPLYTDHDFSQIRADDGEAGSNEDVLRGMIEHTRIIERNGEIVGTINCNNRGDFGFWVAERYRGQGIASAAVKLYFAKWAVPFGHYAGCWADNPASRRVLEKSGFCLIDTTVIGERTALWFDRVAEDDEAA